MPATHSQRLERWLGADAVAQLSHNMREFYWPVPLHGVPGSVHAMPGGDFRGHIEAGQFGSALDRAYDLRRRLGRQLKTHVARAWRTSGKVTYGRLDAFSTLQALLTARGSGKGVDLVFSKTLANIGLSGQGGDTWMSAGLPAAGAAGAAAPGGTSPTNTTTGAMAFNNAVVNANSSHFVGGYFTVQAGFQFNSLLLYDRLFSVAKTMNSTATESVTGTFSRYQSQTSTDQDYIGGNFCYPAASGTSLAATAHNWTVCQYTNQAGATAKSFPSATGVSGCSAQSIDLQDVNSSGLWFMPLASGDVGVKALTQMQCSALVATGTIDFVVAHPIAWMSCPVASLVCSVEQINTAFNLAKIYDNAALALLGPTQPTGGALVAGKITIVSE